VKDEGAVRQVLTEVGKPVCGRSIEVRGVSGVADWNYVHGWIECKEVDRFPVRGGPLRLPHPKRVKLQAIWLLEYWRKGGKAHACIVVGDEWLLLDAPTFFDLAMRGMTRDEMILRASRHWTRLNRRELLDFLQEVRTP